jgi:F-box interacting protein
VTFLDEFCRPFNILRYLTHCDALLFALTNTGLYLFNPATRDAITLPDSHRNDLRALGRPKCYRAGLGLDPRIGRYKVVQAFYRSVVDPDTGTGTDMGMEVFTVGDGGGGWREIAGDPPYPARRVQNALAASGFMFWRLAEPLEQEPWGILDLSLDDEEFDVTGLPDDLNPEDEFFLDVLHGRDLCLTACNSSQTILNIWVLPIADEGLCTMWDWRYAIEFTAGLCHTMALPSFSSNGIILWRAETVYCYELATDEVKVVCELRDMRYQRAREWKSLFNFSTAMPFTESLVQITSKSHQGSSWNPWIKLLML